MGKHRSPNQPAAERFESGSDTQHDGSKRFDHRLQMPEKGAVSSYPPAPTALRGVGAWLLRQQFCAAQSSADSRQSCPEAKLIERDADADATPTWGSRSRGGVFHRHHPADMCVTAARRPPSTCNICNKRDEVGIGLTAPHPSQACATSSCAPMSPPKSPFPQHLTQVVVTGGRSTMPCFAGEPGTTLTLSLCLCLCLSPSGARLLPIRSPGHIRFDNTTSTLSRL